MSISKKYELTEESKEVHILRFGRKYIHTLYRIRALRNFGNVKAGDLGGFIEKEDNLSHYGDCWVGGYAEVYDNAWMHGDALVSGCAEVYDNARVYGDALISGNADVFGNAQVHGDAQVYDNALVYDDAHIYDNARVHGKAHVCCRGEVCGEAEVAGDALVLGGEKVCSGKHFGDAEVDASTCTERDVKAACKDDAHKSRVDLIPPSALFAIGHVLAVGARKYGANNWRNGMNWSRLHGAALRHLLAWFDGEDKDPESGLSHLAHAACCLLFLMDYDIQQIGCDDRPQIGQ
ncbi:dATP/dGTP diphosphohydrolase domain-containing protein [Bartonella sp. WD16.2]|uniref:dATP/dGTP diphosphohydrolase domain-containing protein n=1 Tax=Bartonella sp. WD16.2 TaxID=1933904 RepID=UPI000999DADB|nr:dATP/dGTP diphosphohydrolase domain-containing protein [Bartonella sp. WD16.2]